MIEEPINFISDSLDEIKAMIFDRRVLFPPKAKKELLFALGSGNFRFICEADVRFLHPDLNKDLKALK
jgi:hypothetical protein